MLPLHRSSLQKQLSTNELFGSGPNGPFVHERPTCPFKSTHVLEATKNTKIITTIQRHDYSALGLLENAEEFVVEVFATMPPHILVSGSYKPLLKRSVT